MNLLRKQNISFRNNTKMGTKTYKEQSDELIKKFIKYKPYLNNWKADKKREYLIRIKTLIEAGEYFISFPTEYDLRIEIIESIIKLKEAIS